MKVEIEFELHDLVNKFLLGIHLMECAIENTISGEIKDGKTLQIGFIFFSILIHFENK